MRLLYAFICLFPMLFTSGTSAQIPFVVDSPEWRERVNEIRRAALNKYFLGEYAPAILEFKKQVRANEIYLEHSKESGRSNAATHYDLVLAYGRIGRAYKSMKNSKEAKIAFHAARNHSRVAMQNGELTQEQLDNLIDQIDKQQRLLYPPQQ